MGFTDNLSGYHKYKNVQNFTNETLFLKLREIPVSFADSPKMDTVAKKETIVYTIPDSRFIVYVKADKNVEVATCLAPKENVGKFIGKELLISAVSDAQGKDQHEANRAVDEVGDILQKLLAGQETTPGNLTAVNKNKNGTKLYMRQKIVSIKDKYSICTLNEEPVYWVEGNLIGLSFSIQNTTGNELMKIKKKMVAIMPNYTLMKENKVFGQIKKKIKLTRPEIVGTVDGKELLIKGNLSGYSFEIFLGGQSIGAVDTERLTWGDCYSIESYIPDNTDLVVAIAVICDNVLKSQIS